MLNLNLQSRKLIQDVKNRSAWRAVTHESEIAAYQTALVICDVWDKHWSRGATERLDAMVPRMNEVIKACRKMGLLIVAANCGMGLWGKLNKRSTNLASGLQQTGCCNRQGALLYCSSHTDISPEGLCQICGISPLNIVSLCFIEQGEILGVISCENQPGLGVIPTCIIHVRPRETSTLYLRCRCCSS